MRAVDTTRRRRTIGLVIIAGWALAACADDQPQVRSTSAQAVGQSALEWGPCDDDSVSDPALECTTLTVPLDYEASEGDTIDLALVRLPATEQRQGAVLVNPGGPGDSGFDFAAFAGTALQVELGLEAFDIVGFDPRGVDRSGGLRCLTDAEVDASIYLDDTPDTPEEQALFDAAPPEFDQACVDAYGDSLRHYSTANTARDMDAIRAALGDQQLSYLGVSYGTYLGGVYATLFPDRVRALVLDAAFDPAGDSEEEAYSTQLVGFESAFDNWATWCRDTPDECAFSSSDVGADWDALLEQLDLEPILHTDGRWGNDVVMDTATTAALYDRNAWPSLATALAEARNGSAAGIFALADTYNGRSPDGSYSTQEQSFAIISCASGFVQPEPTDPEALAERLRELAPRFGAEITADDLTGDTGCDTLVAGTEALELSFDGDAPILVIGGENDPATPIRWAEEMTAALGPSASLVRYTGEGHGFVLVSSCATEAAGALLRDLAPPAPDTVCEPDPEVPEPAWWDDLPLEGWVDDVERRADLLGGLGLPPTMAYGEVGFSALAPDDILDAADEALAALPGAVNGGRQQPIAGIDQGIYLIDDEVFSVLVIDQSDLASPEFEGLAPLLAGEDRTLVVLLHFPA